MTAPVTLKPKCYINLVYTCPGCGLLFPPGRSDMVTCSGACRVKAHRNGNLRRLRALAASADIPFVMYLRCEAIKLLCPHLVPEIMLERIKLEDTRAEVWAAYWSRIQWALDVTCKNA